MTTTKLQILYLRHAHNTYSRVMFVYGRSALPLCGRGVSEDTVLTTFKQQLER